MVDFHWVYVLPVTPADGFWCLGCSVVVSEGGRRVSQSLLFSGELVSEAGHTSASPWAAAAGLPERCL